MHTIALLILLGLQTAAASVCALQPPRSIGNLDAVIDEASGIAVSRRVSGRLYQINDSGGTGRLYITDRSGANAQVVDIAGFKPVDTEDLSLAPCDAAIDCLFIGDIGDNQRSRPSIEIVVIEEREQFGASVRPRSRVKVRYPDGSHDAESLSVHPDGSIYIVTKDFSRVGINVTVAPVQIFRLKPNQWRVPTTVVQTLELVGTLDLGKLLPRSSLGGRLVTGMSISPNGKAVLLLTYENAIELFLDFSSKRFAAEGWKAGQDYREISLLRLEQQEAISYTANGRGFIYTTERTASTARIVEVRCKD